MYAFKPVPYCNGPGISSGNFAFTIEAHLGHCLTSASTCSTVFSKMAEGLQISPLVSTQYSINVIDKFHERGAGLFDLTFKQLNVESFRTTLELITFYTKTWNHFTFAPQVNIGWQREFLQKGNKLNFKFSGEGFSYASQSFANFGRNYLIAGIDLLFYFYEQYGIEASWDFEWNKIVHDSKFFLGFNYSF